MTSEIIYHAPSEFAPLFEDAIQVWKNDLSRSNRFVEMQDKCGAELNISIIRRKATVTIKTNCVELGSTRIYTYDGDMQELQALLSEPQAILEFKGEGFVIFKKTIGFRTLESEFIFVGNRPIGDGTFGEVWKVRKDGKEYVLKIEKEKSKPRSDFTSLFREASMLEYIQKRLGGCDPQIVCLHDAFRAKFRGFKVNVLQLDFIRNAETLETLSTQYTMEREDVKDITVSAFRALKKIHDMDVVHMDIKPANIMIENFEKAVLIDFGFSCGGDKNAPQCPFPFISGTPLFESHDRFQKCRGDGVPEICSLNVKKESDVWALALSIWNVINKVDIEKEVTDLWQSLPTRGRPRLQNTVSIWIQKQWEANRWPSTSADPINNIMEEVLSLQLKTADSVLQKIHLMEKRLYEEISQ